MRGEYVAYALQRDIPWGSSPLARGILNRCVCKSYISRIIPACAGNTKSDKYCQNLYWDHPRLCGEYAEGMALKDCLIGSSPLVRGILLFDILRSSTLRIIPACAGNTPSELQNQESQTDHPRLCGEYKQRKKTMLYSEGSSPLVRGILCDIWNDGHFPRIIPACAGNTCHYTRFENHH